MKGLSAPLEIAWVATFFIWMVLLLVGPLRGLILDPPTAWVGELISPRSVVVA